ncbi:ISLre2 family transposase [Pseudobutyrivibrio xylanivorans]|uniref:ISLre2 family transposase n=1 Tax=Pseudobutyrivibrio xylanivorans TaxID=185007 RepID=A0A5P6VS25_PSEXY|nr:ISLre2 family transposase [Pseudobutyrivibrio xylanivorans]QFJ55088.1 ISLre2 family transposase [Pseudobutyrivibrio xylanivorans]
MEEIIKYFADVFITNLYDAKIDFYKNPQSLAELVIATKKETDELGRLFIQSVLQEMDTLLKELPKRKRLWNVEHKADARQVLTTLGRVTFTRALYVSKNTNSDEKEELCYLLDKLIGLGDNQQMTEDVMANIYSEAVQTSYRKAGEVASIPEGVTKTTVKNLLHKTKFPKNFQIPEIKKEVDYLYIDADEDHYHLQFKDVRGDLEYNDYGRKLNGSINRIIYVFEGIEPEAPRSKRNRLVGTHYFCRGDEQDNKELWKEVFDYVEATYDVEKIKKIYINADGGAWIKTGYRGLANVTFVLDEFHISEHVSRMISHMKDSKDDVRIEIYKTIRSKTNADFLKLVDRLKEYTSSENILAKISASADYISSNWMAAKYRLRKHEGVLACSAEGHVYHVLSSRMSTQAMGWSKHGANQMARLREYYYNDEDMLELAKFQKEELPMAAGAKEVILTANDVLASEKNKRSQLLREYGKYSEAIHSSMSVQNSKQLLFMLNGKL